VRSGLEGGRVLPTRSLGIAVLRRCGIEGAHPARGAERSLGSRLQAFGGGAVSRFSWAGRGFEARRAKALEGQKPRRVNGCSVRGNLGGVRTDSQGEQGFEAGEAGGTRPLSLFGIQGNREASTLFAEREPIVLGGTRLLRESVDVGETEGNKVSRGGSPSVGG
jgi:hypothetical protein